MDKPFQGIVLSGGAEKGFIQLGVLHHYVESGELQLSKIEKYAGSSIGSVICLLMICGYEPMDMFMKMYCKDKLLTPEVGGNSIKTVIEKKGLFPIEVFTDLPKKFIMEKYGYIPTLKELYYLTEKELYIRVSNADTLKSQTLSYHTDPDLDCITAVGYSSGLPGLFHQMKYKGQVLVDGGITDNFPIKEIDDGKIKILAVAVSTTELPNVTCDKMMGYIYRLAMLCINSNTDVRCEYKADNINLIRVNWKTDDFLTIGLPTETKMKMFLRGVQAAEHKSSIRKIYVKGYKI